MTTKDQAITGFAWSFIDNLGNQAAQFVIGIILARLLTPSDYGLVGIITVFIVILQAFVDSGFGQALIRKPDIKQSDYSTVFYFNLAAGIVLYFLIFVTAPLFDKFFNQTILSDLIKVLGLTIIINAVTIVQRNKLTKEINFKLQTKISIVSNIVSGIIGIAMAYWNFGVWSLVWRSMLNNLFQTVLLWMFNRWRPTYEFDKQSFKEMFSFGSKLLVSSLMDKIYKNIYYFVIAKYFTPADLGLYTRAEQFQTLFSQNLYSTIGRVSYPVLASIQQNEERLKDGYKKVLKITMFISAILMLGMAAIAKPLILVLLGTKWIGAVEYLQLLCFVGLFFPLHALNLNVLNVKGRSDLFLKLEVIKKLLAVPVIIIGIFLGIKEMIIAMIINSIVAYFLNSQYAGMLISYPTFDQIKDVMQSFLIALIVGIVLFGLSLLIPVSKYLLLTILLVTGTGLIIAIGESTKAYEYLELKSILLNGLSSLKKKI